jgi:uncharacterized C2H2 Zn-finger protein
MPSAPMTAQRQRTTGVWLVRFPCCGKQFPNQTQAVRHLVQAHGYDLTQAIQHCQALAQTVRLQRAGPVTSRSAVAVAACARRRGAYGVPR